MLVVAVATPVALAAQEAVPSNGQPATAPSADTPRQSPDGFLFGPPIIRIGMRAGFNFARASSEIFDFTTDLLTLERGDFGGFAIGGDVGIRVADPVDLVFSVTRISSSSRSEDREWQEGDSPITQRTTFDQTPITAIARVYLTSRGRQIGRFAWLPTRFAPYVGAGGGAIHYQFKQTGSFVDVLDPSPECQAGESCPIFDDTLESDAWTRVLLVNAGADYTINPRVTLNTDLRYHFASGEMRDSFRDFTDNIDLNGLQLSVGVHFQF
jgi:opacity protein-like surface antigen